MNCGASRQPSAFLYAFRLQWDSRWRATVDLGGLAQTSEVSRRARRDRCRTQRLIVKMTALFRLRFQRLRGERFFGEAKLGTWLS